jgi:hypothetical protein
MSRTLSILGCLVTLAACSKSPAADKKAEGEGAAKPAAAESATPTAAADKAAPAPADKAGSLPTAEGQLDCAKLLPADLVEKYFPKAVAKKSEHGGSSSTACEVSRGSIGDEDWVFFTIVYQCSISMTDEMVKAVLDAMQGEKVDGVGRVAEADGSHLRAWDDDTACNVNVSVYGPSYKPLVHDSLQLLTPELLKTAGQ